MRVDKIIILISLFLFLNCEKSEKSIKKQREFSNFPNGVLKHEVLLIDGKRQGVGLQYFDNGRVRSKAFYVEGKIEGESVVYHENGNIRQVNQNALDGSCLSKNYTADGFLERVVEIDSIDRILNYYCYKKDGSRDFRNETKNAIILSKTDTVKLGENYVAEIKLGNQQFKIVDVTIGDTNDRSILKKNPPLHKKDSVTSILTIKADSLGLHTFEGVILEKNAKMDSFDVIFFDHSFFVKEK